MKEWTDKTPRQMLETNIPQIRTPRELTICVIPLVSKSAGSLPSYFYISECFCACLLGVLVVKEDLRKKKKTPPSWHKQKSPSNDYFLC